MNSLKIRCCLTLATSATLACSTTSPSGSDLEDEVGASESTGSTEGTESTEAEESTGASESTEFAESTDETESTDGTEDSGDEETTTTTDPPPDLPPIDPNENIPPLDEEGCPAIYAQDLLPTFELFFDPEVWDLLVEDWLNGKELKAEDKEYNPKRPVEAFVYEDIIIYDAVARVRGNPKTWDPEDKIQLAIDFNEVDPKGHFLGLRQVALDAATANRNMLRDRLSLWIMRDMGVMAPCANHARVNVNGEYFAIYTNVEKLDKSFLERVFVDPSGGLWDRHSWELKTNEDTADLDRLEELLDADSISELEDYLDLEQALRVFAAEAILPNSDGMWAGGLNFFVYDDPIRGKFVMLPWDLDNTFDRFNGSPDYPLNPDPVTWEKATSHGRPWYDLALDDDDWFEYYIAAIEDQYYSSYDEDELHDLIDLWTDQIKESVFEDENKAFSDDLYLDEVEVLHDYIESRYQFLADWLE